MYLLGDIGRTKIRLAVSPDGETIGEPVIKPTPADFDEALVLFQEAFSQLGGELSVECCLGISRRVWPGAPLKLELEKMTGAPVHIENDAALVGLGEAHFGAGRGHPLVVYMTVSTGVGGVKIEHGRIDENALGFEPGQQIIVADSPKTLEDLVSGAAVQSRFGRPPREITDEKIWQELSHYLAIGLANTLLHWSPNCLVLGGSMFKTPGFQVAAIENLLVRHLKIFSSWPVVRPAALGESGGLMGALIYLRHLKNLSTASQF